MSADCIFCKIASGAIPVKIIYEDEHLVAFPDINPVAPVHVLVIPRKHLGSIAEAGPADDALLGHVMLSLPKIAAQLGVADAGFRVVMNTGKDGGQSVQHLHWHILGGRFMEWPPG
ncbi:MAG TPA: histidine triad nucleotide-binding protein [Negativicutes bacterium]|nr:histidine triad nucleotide-binding protein [Negativicutes bacterium]